MSSNVSSADKPVGYAKITAETAEELQSSVEVTREAALDLLKRIEAAFGINIKNTAALLKVNSVLDDWVKGTSFGAAHTERRDISYAVAALIWLTSPTNLATVGQNLQKVIDSGSVGDVQL